MPITLVLLLLVFGALVAAGIPLLLAVTSVMTALSLLTVEPWLPVGSSTSEVVLIIGMAVGVDYSLFYLRREREERAAGRGTAEALRIAAATSGRAIVVSGLTVMVALAGLFLTGYDVFTGIALGTIAVVGVAVLGSLTVLPALLSWLGHAGGPGPDPVPWPPADGGPALPRLGRAGAPRWPGTRPPGVAGGLPSSLLALAAPASGMRLGSPPDGGFSGRPGRQTAIDRISGPSRRRPSPAQVVVTGQDLTGPAVAHAISALRSRARPRRPAPGAGHAPAGRRRARADHRCPAGRERHQLRVRPGPAHPARPGTAADAGPGARDQLRGDRGHRGQLRRHRRPALRHPGRVRLRGRAGLPAAAGGVPVGHDPADLDRR